MKTKEFQKHCADIVTKMDDKYKIERSAQLALAQLVEELGELAKEVNRKNLRHQEAEKGKLEEEFADVFLQLAKMAEMHGIDLEGSVRKKITQLKEKGYL